MNRSTDEADLLKAARSAQAVQVKRQRMDEEARPGYWHRRGRNWTRAFEMLALQGLAVMYVAVGIMIGFGIALLIQ